MNLKIKLIKEKVSIVDSPVGKCYAIRVKPSWVAPDGWLRFAYVWACPVGSRDWIKSALFAADVHEQDAAKWAADAGKRKEVLELRRLATLNA